MRPIKTAAQSISLYYAEKQHNYKMDNEVKRCESLKLYKITRKYETTNTAKLRSNTRKSSVQEY